MDRYRRQVAFQPIGPQGQKKIDQACVAICGVGALGSAVAERLCRAGVGRLILIDRDWVELDNLPRQTLYTEDDALRAVPKSIALSGHLSQCNSSVRVDPHVCDLHWDNIGQLFQGASVIVDGTDNFETRYLLNDYCCKHNVPWVHAGIVGATGQSMTIVPGKTACFRCLLPDPPPAEQMQTCDSAGVIGPAVGLIANWQAIQVMKLLVEGGVNCGGFLHTFDLWNGEFRKLAIPRQIRNQQSNGCVACEQLRFDFLDGRVSTQAKAMCGRNAVQIQSNRREPLDLSKIVNRLAQECVIKHDPIMIRFELDGLKWSVFHDGRAVLSGTEDVELARKLYSRRIGN